jgi:multicomponent Na+:H+ antiporter subunit G
MSIGEIITAALVGAGAFFILVAAIGILRFRDLPMRMHASSKASTLGVILILSAVAVHTFEIAVTARIVLISAFLLATAPVAAHAIARAAYRRGIELSPETEPDELADR